MRYTAPGNPTIAGQPFQASQQICAPVTTPGGQSVLISNPGATNVWVSENQASLDTSIDGSGTPQMGHIVLPGQQPFIMRKVRGGLYARSVNGGVVECTVYPECGP